MKRKGENTVLANDEALSQSDKMPFSAQTILQ